MKKIKILKNTIVVGAHYKKDQVVEVKRSIAEGLIELGFAAEYVEPAPAPTDPPKQ